MSALDSGLSRADLIEVFMDSEEFRFEGKFITQTYLGILTRDADYAGFRGWLGALLVGVSREQIVQVFLDSGEFQSRFGSNLTNGQFVERMYNNILLRSSDPGGFNAWVGALNNGQLTKAQMALRFLDSGEFQGLFLSQNRVDISLLYFDMLQRDPDAGGFSYWVEVLSSGVPLTSVIDGFLNSPEYRAGFKPGSPILRARAAGTIDRRRGSISHLEKARWKPARILHHHHHGAERANANDSLQNARDPLPRSNQVKGGLNLPDTRIFSPLAVAGLCVTIGRYMYLFKRLTAVFRRVDFTDSNT